MNKAELVMAVAEEANLSKAQAERAVKSVFGKIESCVAAGEKVTLVGFGTFEKVHRNGRTGRNPQTGEQIQIADKFVPKFSAGKKFADACR